LVLLFFLTVIETTPCIVPKARPAFVGWYPVGCLTNTMLDRPLSKKNGIGVFIRQSRPP
jgi:hypothetical protein